MSTEASCRFSNGDLDLATVSWLCTGYLGQTRATENWRVCRNQDQSDNILPGVDNQVKAEWNEISKTLIDQVLSV